MWLPKFYVTTSIPYVNARPHIGHALEFAQADVIARYRKLEGYETYLVTGTDENSLKNVLAAEKLGLDTGSFCERNSAAFRELVDKIGLSYDAFVRTSVDAGHGKVAEFLWKSCSDRGDIYKKKYRGLYCVGCELFYTEDELDNGLCPEHRSKPELVEEENYFFRLSRYQERLAKLLESGEMVITPASRLSEILNFINSGLSDFSISRSVKRSHGWGVPVPGDTSQIMYVWFDALGSYLTGAGFISNSGKFERLWPADMHVIGKGIVRFHAVYWPAMLLSAGIALPKSLFIHGYVTVGGQKMSKSIGNVVDPVLELDKYGADQLRYYLIKEISTFQDGDFSEKALGEVINNELVGNIGNFVNRTLTFIHSRLGGVIEEPRLEEGRLLVLRINGMVDDAKKLMDLGHLNLALLKVLEISSAGNKYFQENEPWKLLKEDDEAAREVLFVCANICRTLGILLNPFMPYASERLLGYLGEKPSGFDGAKKLVKKFEIGSTEILFDKVK